MKKSLSVLVAGAMVSSMFASVAFAATAELDTQGKYDALKALGIFEGTENGAELDKGMTREQLAKIIAKIKEFDTPAVTATSYSDVAADRWSAPFIEAVSKAKPFIMDGTAPNIFNPAGNVTVEQLATVMVRALGLQVKSDAAVKGNVSEWAKGFVAAAVEAKILPEKSDFTADADRATLVEATYAAKQAIDSQKEPAKVSVKEAKAVGVQTVEVKLDKVVDTANATFTLKKGTVDVPLDTTATKWSDDKKTVTLKLKDAKIGQGTYTVTLGGVDATTIEKASAEFTAENEKVTKIEFVTASDTIAMSNKARVQVQPTNQYGEAATLSAGNYTVYATTPDPATLTKSADGKLYVVLDTDYPNVIPNNSQVSINIYDNDQHVSASKVFKIGDKPYVTKIELGNVTYKNGKSALSAAGDTAVISMTQYDQYGGVITKDSGSAIQPSVFVTPFTDKLPNPPATIADDNNDNIDDIVLTLNGKVEKSEELTVSAFGGGSTATAKVKLEASKVATKVELVQPTGTFAYGDNDKYVELVAYDEAGNKLSADDIVDNAKEGRFKITASSNLVMGGTSGVPQAMLVDSSDNSQDYKIVQAGPNKGKIHIAEVNGKGQGNIFVAIYGNGINSSAQINIPLADVRYPDSIRVATDAAAKAVAGATIKPKFQLFDQYGEKITAFSRDSSDAVIPIVQNNKTVTFDVYATVTSTDDNFSVAISGITLPKNGSQALAIDQFSDDEITINTAGAAPGKSVEVKFELRKLEGTTVVDSSVASITRKVTILNSEEAKNLTYSLNAVGDLFNTLEDSTYPADDPTEAVTTSKFAKELVVSAKDAAGNTVAIPKTVTSVTSDVYNVARVQETGGTAYVLGNKVGTANVTVYFTAANGETKFVSGQVNVKNEANRVETITAGGTTKTLTAIGTYHASELMGGSLAVKNQYGNEFKSTGSGSLDVLKAYDRYFQIRYAISDVKGSAPTLNADNTVTVTGEGSFVVTAIAPNGKTAMTTVVVDLP